MTTDQTATKKIHGSCLCGGVAFTVSGALRKIVHCYCGQCRRTHGIMGPYTQTLWKNITFFTDKTLTWFRSSDSAARGFCNACGSSIFWRRIDSETISISAGNLNQPTGLDVAGHIYTEDLPDYHTLPDDGLPRFSTTSNGELDGDLST